MHEDEQGNEGPYRVLALPDGRGGRALGIRAQRSRQKPFTVNCSCHLVGHVVDDDSIIALSYD